MGIRLIVEVLEHAPAELTLGERMVLLVIAEQARDGNRTCWPGIELLARRAGMSPDGVGKALRRLAARGLDPRVAAAHRGRRTVYRLPKLTAGDEVNISIVVSGSDVDNPANGGTTGRPFDQGKVGPRSAKGGTTGRPITPNGLPTGANGLPTGRPFPSSPQRESSSSPQSDDEDDLSKRNDEELIEYLCQLVNDAANKIDEDDDGFLWASLEDPNTIRTAEVVLERIRRDFQPRNIRGYLRKMAEAGDLLPRWDEIEEEVLREYREQLKAERAVELAAAPDCHHGTPNGTGPNITTGFRQCALCRAEEAAERQRSA